MMMTIRTSNHALMNCISNYLHNKNLECMGSLDCNEVSVFNLNDEETDALVKRLTKHFHLKPTNVAAQAA